MVKYTTELPVASMCIFMNISQTIMLILQNLFSFFFFRFHVYVLAYGICFSLSDLLHSV